MTSAGQLPPAPRNAQRFLVLVFLTVIASVPLLQVAVELRRGQGVRALEVFRQKPTSANLRAHEDNLEDASVVARALRQQYSAWTAWRVGRACHTGKWIE